jgi:hypothetical protein
MRQALAESLVSEVLFGWNKRQTHAPASVLALSRRWPERISLRSPGPLGVSPSAVSGHSATNRSFTISMVVVATSNSMGPALVHIDQRKTDRDHLNTLSGCLARATQMGATEMRRLFG